MLRCRKNVFFRLILILIIFNFSSITVINPTTKRKYFRLKISLQLIQMLRRYKNLSNLTKNVYKLE